MTRGASLSQAKRSLNNPLVLGTFSSTSLRYLRGSLGPANKVIGRADTKTTSNGGFGGGAYNHWYQINLTAPAWIILTKGPPRPKYINVSTYDLNRVPIGGLPIFDADSITDGLNNNGDVYIPYLDTVMSSQSDLYNTYNSFRLDRGDERYYPLGAGSYLICISTTRNEPLDYEVGIVIEFAINELFISLEDESSLILQEDGSSILAEPVNEEYYNTIHDHSLSEWRNAWIREHQDTDKFPDLFIPLTNRA